MGDGTLCNFCCLRDIERRAAKRGAEVTCKAADPESLMKGWLEVIESDRPGRARSWFMAITAHCVC